MTPPREPTGLEIAVIGMAARYPGAPDVEALWALLRDGVEPITRLSAEEIAAAGSAALATQPGFTPTAFVLDDIDLFDAGFFGYAPHEAEALDPQHRLFLECASEALERAGCDPDRARGPIAVFAGSALSSYLMHNLLPNREVLERLGSLQVSLANDKDYLATRVAYKLGLEGPAVTVQTACSTSLVAIHLACQSLLAGECDVALAGGVSIHVQQRGGHFHQEGGIASRDGHCRPFDAEASGTAGSNGVGVVVLKRLADALADGDSIEAVVLGSAINNDGSRRIGFTAPGVEGQAKVIEAAQRSAGVSPADIGYIEAHGTATPLGDPIEIAALTRAFRLGTDARGTCAIGSIKSNFGHADAAAGVAGFIKAVLALKHGLIPPSLHFVHPNPAIDFAASPFYVNAKLAAWPGPPDRPRRAGVSSFGLGGTNAHVVLEEPPRREASAPDSLPQLLVLSARTPAALDAACARLAAHLRGNPDMALHEVAWTLQSGRRTLEQRRAVVCSDVADATNVLESLDRSRLLDGAGGSTRRRIVFMFSGQGSQYPQMTRGLYDDFPLFRSEVDRCCELLQEHLGTDLRRLLYPANADGAAAAEALQQTAVAQPALFVVEYALAKLWMAWGVQPAALIGHSIGEYTAACLAGVFSLEDALALVATRGRLMQAQPPGAMLSVALDPDRLAPYLGGQLDLAAVNAPQSCVISGPTEAVAALEKQLAGAGHKCRPLHTSHAFHSSMMQPVLGEFTAAFAAVALAAPRIPFVSNVTGAWITAAEATDPAYWVRQLRQAVRFADGAAAALQDTATIFVEVGPGNTLCALLRQQPGCGSERPVLASVRHPSQATGDSAFMLNALGRLWAAGVKPDWRALHGDSPPRRAVLPTYPFERRRYWIEPGHDATPRPASRRLARDANVRDWLYVPAWHSAPLPDARAATGATLPGRWLVFIDSSRAGEQLAAGIAARGGSVARVFAGQRFEASGPGEYRIDAAHAPDFDRLLDAACGAGAVPDRVLFAWAAGGDDQEGGEADLAFGYFPLLLLLQALGRRAAEPRLRIDLLTTGVHCITGRERLRPERAALPGLCRVLPQECPGIAWTQLDIESWPDEGAPADRAVARVLVQLAAPEPEQIVAWRGPRQWLQRFERLLDGDAPARAALRERGVYVITGGLGRVGMALAGELARRARARLVLTGRSELPARERWDEWCGAHDVSDPTRLRIEALRAMESCGAEIMVCRADVTDRGDMTSLSAQIRERFGPVNGIVHAAGIVSGPSFALLRDLRPADCAQQFHVRVAGLRLLAEVFAGDEPDFVIATSSLSAVLGGLGMGAYAAANAVMDALAHSNNVAGKTAWMSVDWDAWQGAAAGNASVAEGSTAALALSSEEGAAAFSRLLEVTSCPQVVVSTADLNARIARWTGTPAAASGEASLAPRHERPALATAHVAPRTGTERGIAAIWQELFRIEQVGLHDDFFELGGHSLLALQITARMREQFRVDISLARFLELATVAKLASHVDSARAGAAGPQAEASADAGEREEISL
jgi:acyl transferase domain-containing protein